MRYTKKERFEIERLHAGDCMRMYRDSNSLRPKSSVKNLDSYV